MSVKCIICDRALRGRQRRFCSSRCKLRDTNNRHQAYRAQGARGVARKLEFIHERGGGCERCGYRANHAALVWHHLDPRSKTFEMSVRAMSNRSMVALRSEVAKCQLLCQNCHMEVHHPRAAMPSRR